MPEEEKILAQIGRLSLEKEELLNRIRQKDQEINQAKLELYTLRQGQGNERD